VTAPLGLRPHDQPRSSAEVRRNQVLDAALRLITRDGYVAATMQGISREICLTKPCVYAAYPSREPLLLALLDREEHRSLAALAAVLPALTDAADFDDALLATVTHLLTAVAANPRSWRLLLLPDHGTPPVVGEHIRDTRQRVLATLRAFLEWGRDQRPGLVDVDLEIMAQSLLACIEHAAHMVLTDPTAFTPQRYRDFTRTMLAAYR
jgi:AcrR family transcriptional regulator